MKSDSVSIKHWRNPEMTNNWTIDFIKQEDFEAHVFATIQNYGKNLQPIDLKKFNSNIIDPIKMIFDKSIYNISWKELINNEIFRQRDKTNNNSIGYFHQRIFKYIKNCHVPENGKEGGWDVIYRNPNGIELPDGNIVHTIFVEMKNKHNTMNSSAASKTYIKMQNQLLKNDDCACFLVEAIAKQSQNIKWTTTVDHEKVSHKFIRRVSLDQFYALVTGQPNAFYKICMKLPDTIEKILGNNTNDNYVEPPSDTAYFSLEHISKNLDLQTHDIAMAMAIYLLGFGSYNGFKKHLIGLNTVNDFFE